MLTVCCVQVNNYLGRGAQYVNNLYDMVLRNLPGNLTWRFQCFTDSSHGLNPEIEVRRLPSDLTGWHNKLYLFKRGVFKEGERVMFLDLDTLITGALDELVSYEGEFATLRDFWRPEGLGPAVMLWRGGYGHEIWTEYKYAGKPYLARGDQEWLENYFRAHQDARYRHVVRWTPPQPDILQDLYPGLICSYKTHCKPFPPQEAAIVCFHGEPRPHNCLQGWVWDIWRVGGASSLQLKTAPNTDDTVTLANVRANENAAPWVMQAPVHDETAIICGSGPSLMETIPFIVQRKNQNGVIFALNNAAKALNGIGLRPNYQVMLDARQANADEFLAEDNADAYLIASQCHPDVFKAAQGRKVYLWHPMIEGIADLFPKRDMALIGGGTTVGLSAIALAYTMGFRKFALFGYDSSHRGEQQHTLPQSRTDVEKWQFDVWVGNRKFRTNAAMGKQAELFEQFARNLAEMDCEIAVYGDGLLPYIAHKMVDWDQKAA